MDKTKRFYVNEPGAKEPIVFDQIFAEKVGGGLVKNHTFDLYPSVAISADGYAIKGYRVVEDAADDATSIKIAKNSGIASGDVIGKGNVAVACTAVDTTSDAFDVVTVTLGVAVSKGDVLFEAAAASATAAAPKYAPAYLLGQFIEANSGDELVKLVNGANIRKETALVADEVVALMKNITKI